MRSWIRRGLTLLGFALSSAGCGPSFDPPSELHSLRALGVQKDQPYAQPGQSVNLQLLWQDASLDRGRPVQIAWSPPCVNPPGDLYYSCFSNTDAFGGMLTLNQETTRVEIPTTVISARPKPTSNNAPYGLTYVFFALCAGQFTLVPQTSATSFPIGCKGADGTLLGSDDFIAGYTAIYSFESISNKNPVISGFRFNGYDFPAAPSEQMGSGDAAGAGNGADAASSDSFCVGEACRAVAGSTPPLDVDCTAEPLRCIPTCADDGDPACPAYPIRPIVDPNNSANRERDNVSASQLGRDVGEQMWIDYYAEAGGFKSPVRLLNDATTGWNENYGTDFYAPKAAGSFRVWAVVHDNRGGVAWSGVTLKAE